MIDRQLIFDKCNGRCAYCGCEIHIKKFQIDHIHPKAGGGNCNRVAILSPIEANIVVKEEFQDEIDIPHPHGSAPVIKTYVAYNKSKRPMTSNGTPNIAVNEESQDNLWDQVYNISQSMGRDNARVLYKELFTITHNK